MERIVLDSKSHQAIRERGTEDIYYGRQRAGEWRGQRLSGLRDDLKFQGDSLDIIDLLIDSWADASVLIIAGRHDHVLFTDSELDAIADFSQSGGGIFLMANHPPSFVSPQNQVCKRLNLPVSFQMSKGGCGRGILHPHEISEGCDKVHIRTSCGMSVASSSLVATIAEYSEQGSDGLLAAAIEAGDGHAKVVAMGSAGHIASLDDSHSDLYSTASNARWTIQIINWLRRVN